MTTIRICERWDMDLPAPDPDDPWFANWALAAPKQAGLHLTAGWLAYRSLIGMDIRSAREYFGGVGAQTLMIDELFQPEDHFVMDYSTGAAEHLGTLPSDAYDPANTAPADLVALDFGDLTVWKTRIGLPHGELLDRVFLLEPKAVVLTDVAGPRLHLHQERYASMLGPFKNYPEYLERFADYIQQVWGYTMVAGYWHRWSTVMALVPEGQRGSFEPTPDSPKGLEVL